MVSNCDRTARVFSDPVLYATVHMSTREEVEPMNEQEKLPIIVRHWIEHNESHLEEYRRWARTAEHLGLSTVRGYIEEAVEALVLSNTRLLAALSELESR